MKTLILLTVLACGLLFMASSTAADTPKSDQFIGLMGKRESPDLDKRAPISDALLASLAGKRSVVDDLVNLMGKREAPDVE
uniref:(Thr2, Ile9)-kassinin n=1 Tax=Kassina senegalensis TaxID=8415 RepID=C5J873_KASSE|nr:(Thr2, Ile9)-kassinin precursor [Kassina senegalensis]